MSRESIQGLAALKISLQSTLSPWILEVEVLVVAHDSDATVRRGVPTYCLMLFKRLCTFAFVRYFKSFPSRQRRLLSGFSSPSDEYDALAVARMKQWREIK